MVAMLEVVTIPRVHIDYPANGCAVGAQGPDETVVYAPESVQNEMSAVPSPMQKSPVGSGIVAHRVMGCIAQTTAPSVCGWWCRCGCGTLTTNTYSQENSPLPLWRPRICVPSAVLLHVVLLSGTGSAPSSQRYLTPYVLVLGAAPQVNRSCPTLIPSRRYSHRDIRRFVGHIRGHAVTDHLCEQRRNASSNPHAEG